MPEEKTIIGVPEDVAEKLKSDDVENVRDILDVPGRQSELWVDGKAEKHVDAQESASEYERKLSEVQAAASASAQTTTTKNDDVKFDADAIRHMEDAAGRVQKLLDLARVKGVAHAVSVAEHIDAYTLDITHDRIADELSDELRKQGLLDDANE
ncbi:MAG: hypothetical protein IPJ67_00765 [Candidatus Moraniibacteriota bacterium]|nr:MAG: hypothetical protein IPJ67_00765 [Candidatus Moranbacteria bacterium]